MEGSESEAVFESLNLKPQLLINEALNIVDDLLEEAFGFFLQEGSKLLKTEGTDRSADLSKGVEYIQNLIQSNLDERLQKWEEYCHRFCFHVPDGISLPEASGAVQLSWWFSEKLMAVTNNDLAVDDLPNIDALAETDLDEQLKSLRRKLSLAREECAQLNGELCAMEKQSLSSSQSAGSIDEALQLWKEHNINKLFHELTTTAPELFAKLGNLKRRRPEEIQGNQAARTCVTDVDVLRINRDNGLFDVKLEELEKFLDEISKS